MNGSTRIPAVGHLFNVNKDTSKLPENMAQHFDHLVAQDKTFKWQ